MTPSHFYTQLDLLTINVFFLTLKNLLYSSYIFNFSIDKSLTLMIIHLYYDEIQVSRQSVQFGTRHTAFAFVNSPLLHLPQKIAKHAFQISPFNYMYISDKKPVSPLIGISLPA